MKTLSTVSLLSLVALALTGCNTQGVEQTASAGTPVRSEMVSTDATATTLDSSEVTADTTDQSGDSVPTDTDTGSGASSSGDEALATNVEAEKAQAKPADPPAKPKLKNEIERIGWDDLKCNVQEDIVVRDFMVTERARELDGQRVRIQGIMFNDGQLEEIQEFVLVKNKNCKFGQGGRSDCVIQVTLDKGITTKYTEDIYELTGTLTYDPFQGPDGNTWALFSLDAEDVKIKRR